MNLKNVLFVAKYCIFDIENLFSLTPPFDEKQKT